MNLQYLAYFAETAETKNMTNAANRLYVSQSALSQGIKKLEKELGHSLFIRTKNDVQLTSYGHAILPHVQTILNEMEIIQTGILNSTDNSSLRVGSTDMASLRYFGATLANQVNNLDIQARTDSFEKLQDDLIKGILDLIFTDTPIHHPKMFCTYICESKLSVSIPSHHRLYTKEYVEWKDLDRELILVPDDTSFMLSRIRETEKEKNIKLKRIYQKDYSVFINLVYNTPYLHFDSTIDHIRIRNAQRRDAVIENPRITTKYYAVCMKKELPHVLTSLTALQKHYWSFEEETLP